MITLQNKKSMITRLPIYEKLTIYLKTLYAISRLSSLYLMLALKNNITMSIAYIYSDSNIITKTIYYTVNITLTEIELFAIRYRINQVIQVTDISHIIAVTNTIYLARCIFNLLSHSYQI